MPDPNPQSISIPFSNNGVQLKKDPALLKAGSEYQVLSNITSTQEGALWTRLGSRRLGNLTSVAGSNQTIHTIRKLLVSAGETPYTPTLNPRYIGNEDFIYRTSTYGTGSFTTVASGVITTADGLSASRRWGFASYNAGSSGQSWAFFAGDQKMLKDNGSAFVAGSPLATLQNWGILPANGVCKAQPAGAFTITGASNQTDGAYTAAQIVAAAPTGITSGTQVAINNIQGFEGVNGVWWVHWTADDQHLFLYQDSGLTIPAVGTGTYSSPSGTAFGSKSGTGLIDNSTSPSVEYDWIFAWVNPTTGNPGNPSRSMLPGSQVLYGAPQWLVTNSVTVTVWATGIDSQIAGANSIAIYRRGGSYTDGIYRLVGYATNSGGNENPITFVDNNSDEDLLNAPQAEFDNDPPVTSTLPKPYIDTLSSNAASPGYQYLVVSSATVPSYVTIGSLVHIIPKATTGGTAEDVVIESIDASGGHGRLRVYTQFPHVTGDTVEVDAAVGTKCNLCVSIGDSLYVAGDANNPNVLYKSKTGRPESFPVIDSNGVAHSIIVGTPANNIVNICDSGRGSVLCLNVANLFEVVLLQGQMLGPLQTPCQRGLFSRFAWTKADNAVWYLAYDGIYSWDGSQCLKRSEAIDPIFQTEALNTSSLLTPQILPLARTPNNIQWARISYYKNKIFFGYRDSSGVSQIFKYETIYDRWSLEDRVSQLPTIASGNGQFTEWYLEEDTGNYIWARYDTGGAVIILDDQATLDGSNNVITTDEYVTTPDPQNSPDGGYGITCDIVTGFYNFGDPLLQKLFQEWVLECDPQNFIDVEVYYDMAQNSTENYGIPSASSAPDRTRVPFLPNFNAPGGGVPTASMGREMYAVAFEFFIAGTGASQTAFQAKFYSLTFKYTILKQLTSGQIYDWQNLGWAWDKKLRVMTVEYDVFAVGNKLILDTLSGINGNQYNPAVQEFTLVLPTGTSLVNPISQSRVRQAFPINDGIIAKEVRLRWDLGPGIPGPTLPFIGKIFDVTFEPFEQYPPDIVAFTPKEDGGNPYEKYVQDITIEVNTNGVDVQFQVQADGTTITNGTFTVNTTINDRKRQFTMPPEAIGRNWNLYVDLTQAALTTGGGEFQLFTHRFTFLPADKGPVMHSPDWDNLGYNFDKRLQTCRIEWEGAGTGLQYNFDTLTGIGGGTINPKAIIFQLTGNDRNMKVFPIQDGQIVKAVRGYPNVAPPIGFHMWLYDFQPYIQLPADIVLFTDFQDFGYPCEKTCRSLWMKIDTGGVPAQIQLELDGVVQYTFTGVTTSVDNLMYTAPIQESLAVSTITFRQARLLLTPGPGGKAQLFGWGLDYVKEPCALTFIDTFETTMGYDGWKFMKQMWANYYAPAPLTLTIYRDTGTLFYQASLPAHPKRDVANFYFPEILNGAFNKSKRYRFQVQSLQPFRWYSDSRVEWLPYGASQRQAFQQFVITPEQQLPVG